MIRFLLGVIAGGALTAYILRQPDLVGWVFDIVRPDIPEKQ